MATQPMLAPAAAQPPGPAPRVAHRGRLFRKYLLLILSLVTLALLASGGIGVYFSYQENKEALASLQHEKALAAASRIEQYISSIEQHLRYAALPQLGSGDTELRRLEFLKLLRQVPDVTDLAQLDGSGREQMLVSRLGMDVPNSGKDRSDEAAFRNASAGRTWFGPVYFRKDTEPYMTIALRSGGRDGPVTIADINLKFIWDVVSRIRIGEEGKAYVVDSNGFLVAHPDIGLVLRKTDLGALPHVAATAGARPEELSLVSRDVAGTPVLASVAFIDPLRWRVFVEQPVAEVYARLNASIVRTGLLLLAGLLLSAVGALALARGMVRPIRTLDEGARRIGAGDLDQQIEVRTGDELEALADQFNRMTAQLRESYAGLERKVEERTQELKQALEQQTAISEILRVISSSPTDVQPVLNAVAARAGLLCDATVATVMMLHGDTLRPMASYAADGGSAPTEDFEVPVRRTLLTGRAALDRKTVAIADVVPLLDTEFSEARSYYERLRFRAALAVPLVREGGAYGVIFLYRREPRAFAPTQIALVETFAQQAAIAIENVRLFNETKEALEQQTAISDILRVISSSPTDVQPVLDAIAERAARLCDAAAASMYLTEGKVLRHLASKGPHADPVLHVDELPIDRQSISGRALIERRCIEVGDMLAQAAEYPVSVELAQRYGHRSVIVMPLLRENEAFGTILLRRAEVRPFTEREIALLRTFGDQAGIAIENVRLFNETKEALDQQTAISEVLRVISSTPSELQPVFDSILDRALSLCAGDIAVLWRYDGSRLRLAAHKNTSASGLAYLNEHPLELGTYNPTPRAALEQRIVQELDVFANPDYRPLVPKGGTSTGHSSSTVIAVPLLKEAVLLGVITIWRFRKIAFTDKQVALLKTFADQAAIAIENVRLFREIEEKSRQLEIANQHKSEFLANMSHELRTPLNAIIGFSEVLLEKLFGELNAKQEDYLKDIHSSGRHLLSLINDILDLSKVEAGRMELERSSFDLPGAIANATTLIRERAQRHGIAINVAVAPELGAITADERKLKQILLNLLTNAVKFTPDGGRIDVTVQRTQNEVLIAVRDTGIGIAPEDQKAVFEEFRQVGRHYSNKQEGTGLGLALTRRFVELHGGRLWVESALGQGSTFSFTLPLES